MQFNRQIAYGKSVIAQLQTYVGLLRISLFLVCLLSACASGSKLPQSDSIAPAPEDRVTVAVFEFEDHSTETDLRRQGLGRTLSDRIIDDLASQPGVRVIDRESIQKILEELSLSSREITSLEGRLRLGKLLGANYLILGGFTSFGESLRIDGRIVTVETGVALGVSEAGSMEARNVIEGAFSQQVVRRFEPIAGLSKTKDPVTSRDFARRGMDFELSNDFPKALEMYQKALALDPQNQEARERMERLLLKEIQ